MGVAGTFVLLVLLLLALTYARADEKDLVKGIRFTGVIALALIAAALAVRSRIGLALLAAAGACALLFGITPPWLRSPQGGGGGGEEAGDDQSRELPRGRRSGMSRAEALEVLGLQEGASEDQIRAAHRRLIMRSHPDQGGSDYLAAKINEAKDVLLRR
jgi:hypothetical protein